MCILHVENMDILPPTLPTPPQVFTQESFIFFVSIYKEHIFLVISLYSFFIKFHYTFRFSTSNKNNYKKHCLPEEAAANQAVSTQYSLQSPALQA